MGYTNTQTKLIIIELIIISLIIATTIAWIQIYKKQETHWTLKPLEIMIKGEIITAIIIPLIILLITIIQ